MLTGRRPAPPPRSSSWTHGRANIPRGIALLRTRRSGMSRLRGQIRRDDYTSEDVQRLETAGNAVFSNRLKRATRFRSCLRLRPRCSSIDYARAATQYALRPSASLRRRQAPTPRAPASTDVVPATEPASRSAPAVHIVFQFSRGQTFPGGTEFLRGQQGTCARLRFATRVCRGDPRSQLP